MTREELLKSKEYWMVRLQNNLFQAIKNYMEVNKLNRTQLAARLNVTKGYITQVLNGDFDHKISKLVDLALSCNAVPLLYLVDLEKFIKDDAVNKTYQLYAAADSNITFERNFSQTKNVNIASVKFKPIAASSLMENVSYTVK